MVDVCASRMLTTTSGGPGHDVSKRHAARITRSTSSQRATAAARPPPWATRQEALVSCVLVSVTLAQLVVIVLGSVLF